MKKLILIFAMIAVYGISISNVSAKVISVEKSKVTVVADDNSDLTIKDDKKDPKKKEKKVTKEAAKPCCAGEKAADAKKEAKTGCSESMKKSCAASKKTTSAEGKSCCGSK